MAPLWVLWTIFLQICITQIVLARLFFTKHCQVWSTFAKVIDTKRICFVIFMAHCVFVVFVVFSDLFIVIIIVAVVCCSTSGSKLS